MAFCKSTNLKCKSTILPRSDSSLPSALHFVALNPGQAGGKVMFYLHGGGYVAPLDIKGQLPFAVDCAIAAGVSELAVLEYSLAPELKYPGQLIQAVEALNYVLQTYDPSQIVLGGESAGGNIILALLAHAKQPNPLVKPLNLGEGRFVGGLIISPWVNMTYKSHSFATNASKDYISARGMAFCTEMWKPDLGDVCANMLAGSAEFWHDLPVNSLLVTAGGWECFLDDILELGKRLGASSTITNSSVELFIGEHEVHVQCALDKAARLPYGQSARRMLDWLRTNIRKERIV